MANECNHNNDRIFHNDFVGLDHFYLVCLHNYFDRTKREGNKKLVSNTTSKFSNRNVEKNDKNEKRLLIV